MIYICKWCGKEFEQPSYRRVYKNKFCSLSCSVSYKNSKNIKGKFIPCSYCSKLVWVTPNREKKMEHIFCNKEHEMKWRTKENHPRYHGGYDSNYGRGWKRQRDLVLERDKTCRNCGTNKKLEAHHIIPFQLSKDNSISNLIILCKSCHSSIGNTYWKLENRPKYFEKINSMRLRS